LSVAKPVVSNLAACDETIQLGRVRLFHHSNIDCLEPYLGNASQHRRRTNFAIYPPRFRKPHGHSSHAAAEARAQSAAICSNHRR
jgi:hypothetical protein